MGVGAYACYKLTTIFPGRQHHLPDPRLRASSRPRSARCSDCRRCASRASISRSRRSPRSSSCRGASCACRGSCNYNVSDAIEVPTRTLFGIADHRAERDAGRRAIWSCSSIVVADDLDRLQSRARPHRAHVDGGARHGYRRRTDRHPALPHQAARLRGVVLLLRRRRRADGVPVARRARKPTASTSTESFLDPVHGDHRRARQPDRLVLRRGLHLGPADRAARAAGTRSASRSTPRPSSTCSS